MVNGLPRTCARLHQKRQYTVAMDELVSWNGLDLAQTKRVAARRKKTLLEVARAPLSANGVRARHRSVVPRRLLRSSLRGGSGAKRTLSLASLFAPASSSAATHCNLPRRAAMISGVRPS